MKEEEAWDESLLRLFSEQLFWDQFGRQDGGEQRPWPLPGSAVSQFTLGSFTPSLCHAALFSAVHAKLWGLREPPSDLFISCNVANKQQDSTLSRHLLDWARSIDVSLHVQDVKNIHITWVRTEIQCFPIGSLPQYRQSPSSKAYLSLPFTVTLCSPVPGWVYRSICMDTSPTGSSTPEAVGRKLARTRRAHTDFVYWYPSSPQQTVVFSHPPQAVFSVSIDNKMSMQTNGLACPTSINTNFLCTPPWESHSIKNSKIY